MDMKKIGGYPHNGYPTDMDTSTGQIFIQRVGYERATTCTLPAPLTSLGVSIILSIPTSIFYSKKLNQIYILLN